MATAYPNDVLLETVPGAGSAGHAGSTAIQELIAAGAAKASLEVILQILANGGGGGTLTLEATVQGSNDRVNWTDLTQPAGPHVSLILAGKATKADIKIDGWAFVRVFYFFSASEFTKKHGALFSSSLNVGL